MYVTAMIVSIFALCNLRADEAKYVCNSTKELDVGVVLSFTAGKDWYGLTTKLIVFHNMLNFVGGCWSTLHVRTKGAHFSASFEATKTSPYLHCNIINLTFSINEYSAMFRSELFQFFEDKFRFARTRVN